MARKVCVLTSAHPAFDVRIFHKESKTLARAGYQVTLIAQARENEKYEGITLKCLPLWKNRTERLLRGPIAVYQNALEIDADVYHFHDPEIIPVALLLRLRGKTVIYDIHEDLPRTISYKPYIPRPLVDVVSKASELIENWAAKRFSALVTATPQIGERFSKINENLAVVNNYPRMEEIQNSLGPSHRDREPSLLYVGMSITRARGAEEMVRSVGLLPEALKARLCLVGNWNPPELPASLADIPGWERVTISGPLNREGVASKLQKAYAGLVILRPEPNYVTSQPVKLFEYMCAGLPVIASDFPIWREIVTQAGCGILVNPLDTKEIARAMEFLLTHPEEAEAMGRRGFQAIVERYNWATEEKTLLRFYDELFRGEAAYQENLINRGEVA